MTDHQQPRYAVYFALPRNSRLWRLAQAWLGRDCETGERLTRPVLPGVDAAEAAAVTESPCRYGFHATLKAPFRLAPGTSLRQLHDELSAFAARQRPFLAPPLQVSAIGRFLALTLSAPSPAMEALAVAAVQELDSLRAPLGDGDLRRRLAKDLAPRQEELLRRWGYPYVMEEFRFHMTLTGALAHAERREALKAALTDHFAAELNEPVPVREICLYSQDRIEEPFLLVDRFSFASAAGPLDAQDSAAQGATLP